MISETIYEQMENDELRMKIMRSVMNIYSTKTLKRCSRFCKLMENKEITQHWLPVNELADMLTLREVVELLGLVEKMDQDIIPVSQLHQALVESLNSWTSSDQEVEAND